MKYYPRGTHPNSWHVVTPDDAVVYPTPIVAIIAPTNGNNHVFRAENIDGTIVDIPCVAVYRTVFHGAFRRLLSTGTTAAVTAAGVMVGFE